MLGLKLGFEVGFKDDIKDEFPLGPLIGNGVVFGYGAQY